MPQSGGGSENLKGTALELFSGLAARYEGALDWTTLKQDRYWKKWIADAVRATPSDRVLDIGCGTLLLEERLQATGCETVGLDLTGKMLRVGQAKRLPRVPLLVNGDAESLPFQSDSFDVVVSCYVPKYVDFRQFVGEVARVAKNGARIAFYDFVRPSGPGFPLLALYTYGGIKIVGWGLGLVKNGMAFTFENLPSIVRGARWDELADATLRENGIKPEVQKRLSGGAVYAVYGKKSR